MKVSQKAVVSIKQKEVPIQSDKNNETDLNNYKGMYFGDQNQKYQDKETGAHFEYNDMCRRLKGVLDKQNVQVKTVDGRNKVIPSNKSFQQKEGNNKKDCIVLDFSKENALKGVRDGSFVTVKSRISNHKFGNEISLQKPPVPLSKINNMDKIQAKDTVSRNFKKTNCRSQNVSKVPPKVIVASGEKAQGWLNQTQDKLSIEQNKTRPKSQIGHATRHNNNTSNRRPVAANISFKISNLIH